MHIEDYTFHIIINQIRNRNLPTFKKMWFGRINVALISYIKIVLNYF